MITLKAIEAWQRYGHLRNVGICIIPPPHFTTASMFVAATKSYCSATHLQTWSRLPSVNNLRNCGKATVNSFSTCSVHLLQKLVGYEDEDEDMYETKVVEPSKPLLLKAARDILPAVYIPLIPSTPTCSPEMTQFRDYLDQRHKYDYEHFVKVFHEMISKPLTAQDISYMNEHAINRMIYLIQGFHTVRFRDRCFFMIDALSKMNTVFKVNFNDKLMRMISGLLMPASKSSASMVDLAKKVATSGIPIGSTTWSHLLSQTGIALNNDDLVIRLAIDLISIPRADYGVAFYASLFRYMNNRIMFDSYKKLFDHMIATHTNQPKIAEEIYQNLMSLRRVLEAKSYNTLIGAWLTAGFSNRALKLYQEMRANNLIPSSITYNMLISEFIDNIRTNVKTIMEEAETLTVDDNSQLYNNLIYSYGKLGIVGKSLELLETMRIRGILPDTGTYNNILRVHLSVGDVEKAYTILEQLEKSSAPKPDSFTYTIFLTYYSKSGNIKEMRMIFDRMKANGIPPTQFAYYAIILAEASVDCLQVARIRGEMEHEGIPQTYLTIEAALQCFAMAPNGDVRQVIAMYDKLIMDYTWPFARKFNVYLTVMTALARFGAGKYMERVYRDMHVHRFQVMPEMLDALVEAFSKMDDPRLILELHAMVQSLRLKCHLKYYRILLQYHIQHHSSKSVFNKIVTDLQDRSILRSTPIRELIIEYYASNVAYSLMVTQQIRVAPPATTAILGAPWSNPVRPATWDHPGVDALDTLEKSRNTLDLPVNNASQSSTSKVPTSFWVEKLLNTIESMEICANDTLPSPQRILMTLKALASQHQTTPLLRLYKRMRALAPADLTVEMCKVVLDEIGFTMVKYNGVQLDIDTLYGEMRDILIAHGQDVSSLEMPVRSGVAYNVQV
ncbi:hypothetical protein BSLG_005031 [Batrachochytrium salamandrivorans]|nr:hypothetical protein BSLG_005031 [Batrachochytrium salamandrivorans]